VAARQVKRFWQMRFGIVRSRRVPWRPSTLRDARVFPDAS
jgi:hypothetical protein